MKSIGKINLKKITKDRLKKMEDEKQALKVKVNGRDINCGDEDDEEEEVTMTRFLVGYWDDPSK